MYCGNKEKKKKTLRWTADAGNNTAVATAGSNEHGNKAYKLHTEITHLKNFGGETGSIIYANSLSPSTNSFLVDVAVPSSVTVTAEQFLTSPCTNPQYACMTTSTHHNIITNTFTFFLTSLPRVGSSWVPWKTDDCQKTFLPYRPNPLLSLKLKALKDYIIYMYRVTHKKWHIEYERPRTLELLAKWSATNRINCTPRNHIEKFHERRATHIFLPVQRKPKLYLQLKTRQMKMKCSDFFMHHPVYYTIHITNLLLSLLLLLLLVLICNNINFCLTVQFFHSYSRLSQFPKVNFWQLLQQVFFTRIESLKG